MKVSSLVSSEESKSDTVQTDMVKRQSGWISGFLTLSRELNRREGNILGIEEGTVHCWKVCVSRKWNVELISSLQHQTSMSNEKFALYSAKLRAFTRFLRGLFLFCHLSQWIHAEQSAKPFTVPAV